MANSFYNTDASSDGNDFGMQKHKNPWQEMAQNNQEDVINLRSRPVSITRNVMFMNSAGKIPIIKEIIIIETEATLGRIIAILTSLFIYSLIIVFITSCWQRAHPKSCNFVINIILFTFPVMMSFRLGEYGFSILTLLFIIKLGLFYFEARRKPMRTETPKKVYNFFRIAYRSSYILSCIAAVFLVGSYLLSIEMVILISLYIFFYGIYYGLIIRESINVISEEMANNIGYYNKDGAPKKNVNYDTCALCDETADNLVMLICKHQYHEKCIKGWLLMGKKNFCPCCRENVNLERLSMNFWDKNDNIYGGLVDNLRVCVIVIFTIIVYSIIKK